MPPTDADIADAYLSEARKQFAKASDTIRHCLSQLTDAHISWRPHESMNSIGNLVLHLSGNVRQWIISGVGGEPDVRDRPKEFAERGPFGKEDVLRQLDELIEQADAVLRTLPPLQLLECCRIQGFDTTGLSAVFDSVAHFKGHTQEIVCLSRMQLGEDYRFEWVPSTPEGALANYVANSDPDGIDHGLESRPLLAFAAPSLWCCVHHSNQMRWERLSNTARSTTSVQKPRSQMGT